MSKTTKFIAALGVVAGIGVAALPLTSYAAEQHLTITATVDSSISLSLSGTNTLTVGSNAVNLDTASTTASVTTNSLKGYTLSVTDKDAVTDLTHTTQSDKKIAAQDGTPTAGTSTWAVQAGGNYTGMTSGLDTSWKAMPAKGGTALVIKNSGAVTSAINQDQTTLKYGVATAANQESGEYTNEITFTATVNS